MKELRHLLYIQLFRSQNHLRHDLLLLHHRRRHHRHPLRFSRIFSRKVARPNAYILCITLLVLHRLHLPLLLLHRIQFSIIYSKQGAKAIVSALKQRQVLHRRLLHLLLRLPSSTLCSNMETKADCSNQKDQVLHHHPQRQSKYQPNAISLETISHNPRKHHQYLRSDAQQETVNHHYRPKTTTMMTLT